MNFVSAFKNIITLFSAALLFSCADDTDKVAVSSDEALELLLRTRGQQQGTNFFELPNSDAFNEIPQDPNNALTAVKVKLGQFLFHETALAIEPLRSESIYTYSCASCHSAGAGFQAAKEQGIGEGGSGFANAGATRVMANNYQAEQLDVQPVRSPTVLNGAYQKVMLWNGQFGATGPNEGTQAQWTAGTPKETNNMGYEGLETQAIAGLKVHRMGIDMNHLAQFGYKELFDEAFPEFPENERYTLETTGLAIAAFERTVLANQAPFQLWLKGQNGALSENQKAGAMLFFGKANCVSCHTGPALNSMSFHALGMNDLSANMHGTVDEATKKGRGGFTQNPNDDYAFKTPQLYNLVNSPFYGHGASFNSIRELIEYKNQAIAENNQVPSSALSNQFTPLGLTDFEVEQILDFVANALLDTDMERYQPEEIPSGFCFPSADAQSMIDLGCN